VPIPSATCVSYVGLRLRSVSPTGSPFIQGERSSDVVASLPVGPGLVRARSDVIAAVMP
jgi:hypothetical protein